MKTNSILATLFALIMFSSNIYADGWGKRKNKCKGGDKKFKHELTIKGGTSNCGNQKYGPAWHCDQNIRRAEAKHRHGSGNGACSCGTSGNVAAEGWACSNKDSCGGQGIVREFGCGWPNKWKAGSSSLYKLSAMPTPMVTLLAPSSEEYISSAEAFAGDIVWNYANNTVELSNLVGVLKKYTPDMVNDYCTFIIEVDLVTGETSGGDEITTNLYRCSVTIVNESLVITDASGTFTSSDFNESTVSGNGKVYTLNTSSKTLPLPRDIVESDELNITIYVDAGNYEEGGKATANPTDLKELRNVAARLDILSNPVVTENLEFSASIASFSTQHPMEFYITNIEGKVVRRFNLEVSSSITKYSVPLEGLENGVYLFSYDHEGKRYSRKLLLDK